MNKKPLVFFALLLLLICSAQAMRVGGFRKQNVAECKEAADFLVDDLNRRSNSIYPQHIKEIESCETQVVAGINYRISVRLMSGAPNDLSESTMSGVVYERLGRDENGNAQFEVVPNSLHAGKN